MEHQIIEPETFLKRGYSFPIDIWSFGVTCYQLITRTLPFYDKDKKIQKIKLFLIDFTKVRNSKERRKIYL